MRTKTRYRAKPAPAATPMPPPADTVHVHVPPEPQTEPEDEAKTALRSRVAELETAERTRAAQAAALAQQAAAAQQRAPAGMTERQLEWLRAHPETTADELMALKLRVAVLEARRAGLEDDSPEFYHFVERRLGYQPDAPAHEQPTNGETPMPHHPAPPARRGPPVSAPVSRSGGVGMGGAPVGGRRTFSAEQVEWAKRSGISLSEYGKQLDRLEHRKRLGDYPDRQ